MEKWFELVEGFVTRAPRFRRLTDQLGRYATLAVVAVLLAVVGTMAAFVAAPPDKGPAHISGFFLPGAQAQPAPGVPTNFYIAAGFITPAGSGVQSYILTPTGPLYSSNSEVFCSLQAKTLNATDVYLGAFESASTPNAGSPPNYIVLQLSSTVAGTWRCVIMQHPY